MKIIIYQIFTRLFANRNATCKVSGTIDDNGCGKMADFDDRLLGGLRRRGITHVWYTGLLRHATKTDYSAYGIPPSHPAVVKGRAGSPYAIADYYDIDPDLAVDVERRMEEFESLVDRTHRAGLKLVADFVPNHVAREYHSICRPEGTADLGEGDDTTKGFDPHNNFYYCPGCRFDPYLDLYDGTDTRYDEMPARATGNDHFGCQPGMNDWYETVKLNYGVDYCAGRTAHFDPVPDTWHKMLHILLFWAGKGVDAFRCDMAEMVPAEFWAWATAAVRREFPEVRFVGEVYNPAEYRRYIAAGFDYLYDKVGMYDTLRGVTCRHIPASAITAAWQATDDIRRHMLYFLENHDEQRLASDFFAADGRRGVPALAVAALMGTNPFMIYAGQEYGERGMDNEGFSGTDGRTTIFDYWSVASLRRRATATLTADEKALSEVYDRVTRIATTEKAAAEGAFFDLMYVNGASRGFNPDRHFAFLRKAADGGLLIVVANFSDEAAQPEVRLPAHAFDCLAMAEGRFAATDLMTGRSSRLTLRRDAAVPVAVGPWTAAVVKVNTATTK